MKGNDNDCIITPDNFTTVEMSTTPANTQTSVTTTKMNHNFIPVEFAFQNINFSAPIADKKVRKKTGLDSKQILFNVSGVVKPGEVLAIMGSSGAGKTTLLDILSNRVSCSDGKILFNRKELKGNEMRKIASYVTQHDTLMPTMTIRETFTFYANLKLPKSMSKEDKKARVDQVIDELCLNSCQDTLVGNDVIRGVSGGERRRVSIGIEMLTQPSLLFLDEPTSGLDSSTALAIMNTINQLAKAGRTIVCTIHQPRHDIFFSFQKVMLLATGRVVFVGPVQESLTYFESKGFECEEFANPADYLIDCITLIDPESAARVDKLVEEFAESTYYKQSVALPESENLVDISASLHNKVDEKPSQWYQFTEVWRRRMIELRRNPVIYRMRFVQAIIQAVLFGIIFLRLDYGQSSLQSRSGLLMMTLMGATFSTANIVLRNFPSEKALFTKDRSSKVYGVFPYFMGLVNADIFFIVAIPILYSCIIYWMTNLNPGADRFFIFVADMILLNLLGNALGMVVSIAAPDEEIALMFVPLILIIIVMFSGYLLNYDDIPVFLRWVPPISFMRYGLAVMYFNEFSGVTLTCTEDEMVSQTINGVLTKTCPTQTGDQYLSGLGMLDVNLGEYFGILIAFLVGLWAMGYLALYIVDRMGQRNKKNKKK